MVAKVIAEIVGAILLMWIGRYYWTHAEEFCRRGFERSQRIREPWRSVLYPHWFWGTRRCVFQIRTSAFGSFLMAFLLLAVAALTFSLVITDATHP
jgi:hypothetical protein